MTTTLERGNRRSRYVLYLMLLLPLLGGCEFFSNVVVPATDDTDPHALIWLLDLEEGVYKDARGQVWVTSDPNEGFITMATALDAGGARRVTMRRKVTGVYGHPHPYWQYFPLAIQSWGTPALYYPITLGLREETQSGGVGDVVSDGLWTGDYITPGSYESLLPSSVGGRPLYMLVFTWWAETEDMHGNVSISPPGYLVYHIGY